MQLRSGWLTIVGREPAMAAVHRLRREESSKLGLSAAQNGEGKDLRSLEESKSKTYQA